MQFTLNALATLPGVVSLLQSGDASNPAMQTQWPNSAMVTHGRYDGSSPTARSHGPITPTAGETAAAEHAYTIIQRTKPPPRRRRWPPP